MTALIVDDEAHARERLIELLKELKFFDHYLEASKGDEAAALMLTEKITVCFLDINMPGTPIFEIIKKIKNPPLIVFQTAYSEYAVDAFEVEALDYLLKPVRMDRLVLCLQKIKKALETVQPEEGLHKEERLLKKVPVKKEGRIELVDTDDIIKITSEDGLTFAFTADQKYMLDKYLNYYEEHLDKEQFFRVNRADLVNLKYIKNIHPMFKGNYMIELTTGEELSLSRRKKSEFKKIYRLS